MFRLLLAAALAATLGLNHVLGRLAALPYPPPTEMRLGAQDAVTSAALLSLGMRRLGADIGLIRLLVYYGTPERGLEEGHHEHDGHGPHDYGAGVYSELGPRALRILDLDPYWDYPVLYTAGALSFNLHRPQEALQLLREGLRYRPKDPRYLAYMAAIGFHEDGDMAKVVDELTPVVGEEAPTILKNMLAYMNVRLGRREEAVRLYREMLLSRDENYHPVARRALKALGAPAR